MDKKNHFSNYAKIIVLVLALIVLGISTTYAYYTSSITGDASESQLQAGKLDITSDLDSVAAIKADNLNLINANKVDTEAQKVEFYLQSNSDTNVDAKYDVYLTDISISKNLYSQDFKWKLTKSGGEDIVAQGDFSGVKEKADTISGEAANAITEVEDIKLTTTSSTLKIGTTDNLVFRIWLENAPDRNQISLTNGSFSAKLFVEAVPVSSQSGSTEE